MFVILFIISSIFLQKAGAVAEAGAEERYVHECQVWQNVTALVEREPRLNVTCVTNSDCTGFDCAGTYEYVGLLALERVVRHVCFGVDLHPCTQPYHMTVYIDIKEYSSAFLRNISRNQTNTLPGVEEHPVPATTVKAKLISTFEVLSRSSKTFALIELLMMPYIQTPLGTHEERNSQVVMVPRIEVPIPRCDPLVREPIHEPGVCPNLTASRGEGFKRAGQDSLVPKTWGCRIGMLEECGQLQSCEHATNATNMASTTACVCVGGYVYSNSSRACVLDASEEQDNSSQVIIIDDGWDDSGSGGSRAKKKGNTVALVGTLVAVLVTAALVTLVLVVYRRFQRRCRSRADDTQMIVDAGPTGEGEGREGDDDDPLAL